MNKAVGPSVAVSLMLSGVTPRTASSRGEAAGGFEARPDEIPLSDIIRGLENQGYHDFREIERVHGHYEITARNANGKAILYADRVTGSMQRALDETSRRREIQEAYNREHDITPETIRRAVDELMGSSEGPR